MTALVRLKIQQIFEECSKFEERDKKALYEVIGTCCFNASVLPRHLLSPTKRRPDLAN